MLRNYLILHMDHTKTHHVTYISEFPFFKRAAPFCRPDNATVRFSIYEFRNTNHFCRFLGRAGILTYPHATFAETEDRHDK